MNEYNERLQKHGYWDLTNTYFNIYEKGHYINGKKNGYWEEKTVFFINQGHYVDNKKVGYWTEHCLLGGIQLGQYKDNKKYGKWKEIFWGANRITTYYYHPLIYSIDLLVKEKKLIIE